MLYPQHGNRIMTIDSVTSLHFMYTCIWIIDVQQADVLVNVITSKTPELLSAGAIAAAFVDAAGDELQDVCYQFPCSCTICGG